MPPDIKVNEDILDPKQEKTEEELAKDENTLREYWKEFGIDGEEEGKEDKGDKREEEKLKETEDGKGEDSEGEQYGKPAQPKEGRSEEVSVSKQALEELRLQVERLTAEKAELQTQLQSANQLGNLIKEVGLADKNQNEQVVLLKQMKQVAEDLQNIPSLGEFLTKFYSGDLALEGEVKTINDFLPDGEVYIESDAFSDPSSASYKARKQFLQYEQYQENKRSEFLSRISREREERSKLGEGFAEVMRKLVEGFNSTRTKIANDFLVTDDIWNEFIEFYRSGDESVIASAWGAFAKKKGMKSRLMQKVEQNKGKEEFLVNSKSQKRDYPKNEFGIEIDFDEKQRELYTELFGEDLI